MVLEYCKFILSFELDEDFFCMLLFIDYLVLWVWNYEYLICFFQEWEVYWNLFQFFNFVFFVLLVYFLLSQQIDFFECEQSFVRQKVFFLIQQVFIMFFGVFLFLFEFCSVWFDVSVFSYCFFGFNVEISQFFVLSQLVNLYFGRLYFFWKEFVIMSWLEENVYEVL